MSDQELRFWIGICNARLVHATMSVWSVLTSGKDHVAVPRGSEASVCCCSKLL
uniref:Uncharacterized protein n=1 Tax=Vitis vinifera TaxID=29760 RepID=F6HCV0_VITVI